MPTRGFILPGYGIPPIGPVGPPGPQGEVGPIGPVGPAGGNEVTDQSTTTFNGLLKGIAGYIAAAVGGVDYLRPVDIEGKADVGHNHNGVYATAGHDHAAVYAAIDHHHNAVYAAIGHNHDGTYATAGHNHAGVYAPVAVPYNVTALAASWTGTGPWVQTITTAGMTAAMEPFMDIRRSAGDTDATHLERSRCFGYIDQIVSNNGSVTLTCLVAKPDYNVDIKLRVV